MKDGFPAPKPCFSGINQSEDIVSSEDGVTDVVPHTDRDFLGCDKCGFEILPPAFGEIAQSQDAFGEIAQSQDFSVDNCMFSPLPRR